MTQAIAPVSLQELIMTQQLFNHFAFATSMSLERLAERVPAAFAEAALALRYVGRNDKPLQPAQLLQRGAWPMWGTMPGGPSHTAGERDAWRPVRPLGPRPCASHEGHPVDSRGRAHQHRAAEAGAASHRPIGRGAPAAASAAALTVTALLLHLRSGAGWREMRGGWSPL